MVHVLAVDRHPHRMAPRCRRGGDDEAGDARRDRPPGWLRPNVLLQVEPPIEGHLDGVPGRPRPEPLEHILPEKRPIHAKPDRPAARQQRPELRPQVAQKGQPRFPVVDVARAILHAEHVGRLGQVRHDRVVARHLPVMRVEAAEGAFDLQARRHDDPVHIDRPRAHAQRGEDARDHRRVDLLQAGDGRHREALQPPTHGAGRRQNLDLAEALEHRIVLEIRQMPQSPTADDQQPGHQPHHRHGAEVAPAGRPGTRRANGRIEARRAQILPEQLEPGIRGERDVREFQLQIPIDSRPQIGSASSHVRWPFGVDTEEWVAPSFNHNGRPFSISKCRRPKCRAPAGRSATPCRCGTRETRGM
jgi:hypothetical protein